MLCSDGGKSKIILHIWKKIDLQTILRRKSTYSISFFAKWCSLINSSSTKFAKVRVWKKQINVLIRFWILFHLRHIMNINKLSINIAHGYDTMLVRMITLRGKLTYKPPELIFMSFIKKRIISKCFKGS